MRRILAVAVLIIILAGLGLLWVAKPAIIFKPSQEINQSQILIFQLKNSYEKAEQLEGQIRDGQTRKEAIEELQLKLDSLKDSIESLRSVIEDKNPKPQVSEKTYRPYFRLPRGFSVKAAAAVVASLVLVFLVILFKRKAFGPSERNSVLPAYPPVRKKPVPKPPPRPEPTQVEEEEPPSFPAPRAREPERMMPPAPLDEKQTRGSLHAKIMELHQQGFSVRDISSRLKIEQDQVALALRVHGVPKN